MKKNFISIGTALGLLIAASAIAYAITNLFISETVTSNFSKETIFKIDLSADMTDQTIAPGDTFSVNPTVYNDATENMYVFITVQQPTFNGDNVYIYNTADVWKLLSDSEGTQVYAYAGDTMTPLMPGETTDALTDQMTMDDDLSNADYSLIDDINVTINAYAIGTEDVSENPEEAWALCEQLGNIS